MVPASDKLGKNLPAGSQHYRAFVGPPEKYDIVSAMQFNLLTFLGLREHHYLLDIGCGSLRGGRLFIQYLLPGRYFGLEPEQWLIDEGIKNECGQDLITIKAPQFSNDANFVCTAFGKEFDFILAQSVFSHASQIHIKRCISQAKQCMKETTVFAATFVQGDSNYSGKKWIYPGCVTYTLERMVEMVNEFGLECKPLDWYHPNQLTWILITYPEAEVQIPDIGLIHAQKYELNYCRDKLQRLESHPYVKFGKKIKRGILRITKLLSFR